MPEIQTCLAGIPEDLPASMGGTTVSCSGTDGGTLWKNAPTVTKVAPARAANNSMTTLTLTGTNFRAGATVQIGGVDCTPVSVASPTQLTCTYPGNAMACGGQSIQIVQPDDQTKGDLPASHGLQLYSGTASFAAATNFNVGMNPASVAVGDFDGDKKPDLAVANAGSNNVSVLRGVGSGIAITSNVNVGANPTLVTAGDFNGDMKLDLAVVSSNANSGSILLGDGSGGFAPAANFLVGTSPTSLAVGDGSRDFFPPSRKLNRWGVIMAPERVGADTGVRFPVPGSWLG